MKVLWLNDALLFRPESDQERHALATLLASLQRGDLLPEEAPGFTGEGHG